MSVGQSSACSEKASFCSGACPSARFIADLLTARDRSMALLMRLGVLRASEVRQLPLAKLILAFEVLSGPTTGHALTEDGLRLIFPTRQLRPDTPHGRPPGCTLPMARNSPARDRTAGAARSHGPRHLYPSAGNNAGRGVRGVQISIEVMMSTATKPVLSSATGGTEDYFRFVAPTETCPERRWPT